MLYRAKIIVLLLLASIGIAGYTQPYASDYILPLKIPIALSANFGEPRPDHFHSGIDFKTGGQEGVRVYAVKDGYISRIAMMPGGFGNALYIAHPGGTTSVYAHLREFVPYIAKWVKDKQYKNQAFNFDQEVKSHVFPVRQGELIGYSGNTGNSFGAHLHFELRNENQVPFNPLSRGIYTVYDDMPPEAYRLSVYQLQNVEKTQVRVLQETYALKKYTDTYQIIQTDTIDIGNNALFGLDMIDRKNGSFNTFGVYSVQVFYDDALYFEWNMNSFSFDETRYVNAGLDFDLYKRIKRRHSIFYKSPNNALRIYNPKVAGNGVLYLPVGSKAKVDIRLMDDAGNVSTVRFWAKNTDNFVAQYLQPYTKMLYYHAANSYIDTNVKVLVPQYSLYESCGLTVQQNPATGTAITPVYSLTCQPATPPHRNIIVSIKADVPEHLCNKVVMINRGKSSKRAVMNGDSFIATTRNWGDFMLAIDTVPPTIQLLYPKSKTTKKRPDVIRFKIKDRMSSLKRYNGYIDDEWALFEFDAKSNRATYHIDDTKMTKRTWHIVRFVAEDEMGNVADQTFTVYF
ncbi:peptidase M23 [Bacteroidia bacterium]|nr:peptidase M23 [Bacteroidia bacterium]